MHVMLIGAKGQLGTDLLKVLPDGVAALDVPEFDVRDADGVQAVMERQRPDVVINCAALTNVDGCEDDPATAFEVNAIGAHRVARSAESVGAKLAYISTDFVFGSAGPRDEPYREDEAPGPVSVYGASKLAGEHLTQAASGDALIVRTCGSYGHAGARGKGGNFVETMLRLARRGDVIRVVDDQRLSPTSTVECADKLCLLIERGATGIHHVAAPDSCTWFEFARAIFEIEGLDVDLRPISSAELVRPARRPAMSALAGTRLGELGISDCRPWREMLRQYLAKRDGE